MASRCTFTNKCKYVQAQRLSARKFPSIQNMLMRSASGADTVICKIRQISQYASAAYYSKISMLKNLRPCKIFTICIYNVQYAYFYAFIQIDIEVSIIQWCSSVSM